MGLTAGESEEPSNFLFFLLMGEYSVLVLFGFRLLASCVGVVVIVPGAGDGSLRMLSDAIADWAFRSFAIVLSSIFCEMYRCRRFRGLFAAAVSGCFDVAALVCAGAGAGDGSLRMLSDAIADWAFRSFAIALSSIFCEMYRCRRFIGLFAAAVSGCFDFSALVC